MQCCLGKLATPVQVCCEKGRQDVRQCHTSQIYQDGKGIKHEAKGVTLACAL